MTWLISACLTGEHCRYDGGTCRIREIADLLEKGDAVTVCPEQLGGLPTPRMPSEIRNGRVYNKQGKDVTENFLRGAEAALSAARKSRCTKAVLKEGSPSCGLHTVYDGTFSGKRIEGKGIFAAMLENSGVICLNENEFMEAMKNESV